MSYIGAVLFVLWIGYGIAVVSFFRHKMWIENYCDKVGACGVVSSFFSPLLALALTTAVFLTWRRWWVKKPILAKAKKRTRDLVPTAGTIIGGIVGRDELCRVIMQALRDPEIRRPYLLVGGVGTGKTAVLVQLTRMLARRNAVPVPVRLRDADKELNFGEAARKRFCDEVDPGTLASGQAEKVWRQLRRDDQVVVLADGLEEAFPEGHENEKDRDNLIREAIRQADEQKLPLVIASRPHHPLEATTAAIMELEPLSEEAALEYVTRGTRVQDEQRLDWIIETAGVTDAPMYLQMTRQLHTKGLLEHLTVGQYRVRLDTRRVDGSALRWRLLDAWCTALAEGYVHPELALSAQDRRDTINVVSALACIGLQQDSLEVKFEDLIGYAGPEGRPAASSTYRKVWDKLRQEVWMDLYQRERDRQKPPDPRRYRWLVSLAATRGDQLGLGQKPPDPRRYRWLVSLAATRGDQLGLVEARGDRVRFPHSILQAYLGSRFIDVLLQDDDDLRDVLTEPGPGRELLIAMVLRSRASRRGALARKLLDAATEHTDAKAFDIYAAALEIDSIQDAPIHGEIAAGLYRCWEQIRTGDRRTLEEAKLGVVRRFGDAAREIAGRNRESAYQKFFQIACTEESYPVRLAAAQEIGAGGDAAFVALHREYLVDPLPEYLKEKQKQARVSAEETWRRVRGPRNVTETDAEREAREAKDRQEHADAVRKDNKERARIWRSYVVRAWLAPMLVGSVGDEYRENAQKYLEDWLKNLRPEQSEHGRSDLPISLEIALAQGFKSAANRRKRNPYTSEEARAYLIDQAEEMLKYSRFWFTQLTLIHALCLWALPDETGTITPGRRNAGQDGEVNTGDPGGAGARRSRARGAGPAETVARWLSVAGSKCASADLHPDDMSGRRQREHPFVAEAGDLAVLALESGHPERFIWIDESGITSKVGSQAAMPTAYRKHNLWIPPSAGWSALDPGAQQLVADVLVMLNLAEQAGAADSPEARERRLERANRSVLPPCLTQDRGPLEPTRTIGRAMSAEPGSSCLEGCPFELCPYPPRGAQPRSELSEAFCRRQQALLSRRFPWLPRRTATWQGMTPKALRSFWTQMAQRTRPPKPDE